MGECAGRLLSGPARNQTMTDLAFTRAIFEWLDGLSQNNDKAWFDAHRDTYEEKVRDPFAEVLDRLSTRLQDAELPLQGSSRTMFRITRDLRFTKDKRPYSEQVSGLMTPSGEKSEAGPILYLHLGAEGGFAAAGFHQLKASRLKPIRDRMIEKADAFDDVRDALDRAGLDWTMEDRVKTMPRGFADHEDHRHADFTRMKNLIVRLDLPKLAWTDDSVLDRVERFARDAMPLLMFGKAAL